MSVSCVAGLVAIIWFGVAAKSELDKITEEEGIIGTLVNVKILQFYNLTANVGTVWLRRALTSYQTCSTLVTRWLLTRALVTCLVNLARTRLVRSKPTKYVVFPT